MATETTYTCDRCGHSQKSWEPQRGTTDRQMWSVAVVAHYEVYWQSYGNIPRQSAHFCRECMDALAILGPVKEVTGEVREPDIEKAIRAIVRDELEARP